MDLTEKIGLLWEYFCNAVEVKYLEYFPKIIGDSYCTNYKFLMFSLFNFHVFLEVPESTTILRKLQDFHL